MVLNIPFRDFYRLTHYRDYLVTVQPCLLFSDFYIFICVKSENKTRGSYQIMSKGNPKDIGYCEILSPACFLWKKEFHSPADLQKLRISRRFPLGFRYYGSNRAFSIVKSGKAGKKYKLHFHTIIRCAIYNSFVICSVYLTGVGSQQSFYSSLFVY